MSVSSVILSFRTMFDPGAAAGLHASIELTLGDERFHVRFAGGKMKLVRGSADRPGAIIAADPNALVAVVYGGRKLAEAQRAGDLTVKGDKSLVRRFLALSPLPDCALASPAGAGLRRLQDGTTNCPKPIEPARKHR